MDWANHKASDDETEEPPNHADTQTNIPDFMQFVGAKDIKGLMVQELTAVPTLTLPNDAWRDHKKLTKFLKAVETAMNN